MPTPSNNVFRIFWIFGAELIAFFLFEWFSRNPKLPERSVRIRPTARKNGEEIVAPDTTEVVK